MLACDPVAGTITIDELETIFAVLFPPHPARLLMNVFLHIVHEVFLSETSEGEYCMCGVMRTSTTDDGCPCFCWFQSLLPPFLVLPKTTQEGGRGRSEWVGGKVR